MPSVPEQSDMDVDSHQEEDPWVTGQDPWQRSWETDGQTAGESQWDSSWWSQWSDNEWAEAAYEEAAFPDNDWVHAAWDESSWLDTESSIPEPESLDTSTVVSVELQEQEETEEVSSENFENEG